MFGVIGGLCACGRWWFIRKPKTICGARGGSIIFGELVRLSGGGCFGVDYCTLGNFECAIFGVRGGAVYRYGETFCPFCRGGTWRGCFAWVETSAFLRSGNFGVLSG